MKKILLATTIAFSGVAYADNGFYTSLKAGVSDTKFEDYQFTLSAGNNSATYKHEDANKSVYPNISAAIGFDFSKVSNVNARTELEYTYKDKVQFTPNINSYVINGVEYQASPSIPTFFINELRTQSLMLNGYYDFKNKSKFTPYLSAGVGVSRIKHTVLADPETVINNYTYFDETKNNFTWTAGVGISYNITNDVALDLAYRYVDAGESDMKDFLEGMNVSNTVDLTSHDYSLGIRYNF